MSEDVYSWAPEEVQAALEVYNSMPDTATVGEIRTAIDAARKQVKKTAPSGERIITVRPAYDCVGVKPCVHGSQACTDRESGKEHGRHNAELCFTLKRTDAEILVVIGTGWDMPTVPLHHRIARDRHYPQGGRVTFHTARSMYPGQERQDVDPEGHCKDWEACYSNTGYLMADEPALLLVEKGSDAVWEWMDTTLAEAVY